MAKIILESEKELEDYICEVLDEGDSCPVTGMKADYWDRQVRLGEYGVADIIVIRFPDIVEALWGDEEIRYSSTGIIQIIELKKGPIKSDAVIQLSRYICGVVRYLELLNIKDTRFAVQGVLVGDDYNDDSDVRYLVDNIQNIRFFQYRFDLVEGVDFVESCGWYRVNTKPEDIAETHKKIAEKWKDHKKSIRSYLRASRKSKNENPDLKVIGGND